VYIHVLILGPDGSGKTTLSQNLSTAFSEKYRTTVISTHFAIWRNAVDHRKYSGISVNPYTEHPRAPLYQWILTTAKFAKYRIEMTKNWQNKIVVQERGWIDQAIDPHRYRLTKVSEPLINFYSFLLRKPDLVVCLKGNAETIAARKKEQSTDQVKDLNKRIKSKSFGEATLTLDTTELSIEDMLLACTDEILKIWGKKLVASTRSGLFWPKRLDIRFDHKSRSLAKALYRPNSNLGKLTRDVGLRKFGRSKEKEKVEFELFNQLALGGFLPVRWGLSKSHKASRLNAIVECSDGSMIHVKRSEGSDPELENEQYVLNTLKTMKTGFDYPQIKFFSKSEAGVLLISKYDHRAMNLAKLSLDEAQVLSTEIASLGLFHGDFTCWNVVGCSPPFIMDWELSKFEKNEKEDLRRYKDSLGSSQDKKTSEIRVDHFLEWFRKTKG
jgi:thymidylate kinase